MLCFCFLVDLDIAEMLDFHNCLLSYRQVVTTCIVSCYWGMLSQKVSVFRHTLISEQILGYSYTLHTFRQAPFYVCLYWCSKQFRVVYLWFAIFSVVKQRIKEINACSKKDKICSKTVSNCISRQCVLCDIYIYISSQSSWSDRSFYSYFFFL